MVIERSIVILSLDDVFERFLENGVPANQGSRGADHTDVRKRLPHPKPDGGSDECHESNANEFNPFESVLLFRVFEPLSGGLFSGEAGLAEKREAVVRICRRTAERSYDHSFVTERWLFQIKT